MGNLNKFRSHLPFVVAIIAIALAVQYPFLFPGATYHKGDWRISHQNTVVIMKQALSESALPFWTSLVDSGMPFYAMPDKPFLYPPLLLALFFFDAVSAMNILVVFHLALAGLLMYLLMFHILRDEKSSFVSALLFMLSPSVLLSPPFWKYTISFIPLLFFFLMKSFKFDGKKLFYAVLSGLTLALMFFGGGIFPFYYTCLFIMLLFFVYTLFVEKDKVSAGKNLFLVGIILISVFVGLTLIKFVPGIEWSNSINRAEGLGVAESRGQTLSFDNFWGVVVTGITPDTPYPLGVAGVVLVLLSFPFIKNRFALFFWIVLVAVVLFAFGFGYELLYNIVPGLSKQRGVTRALFVLIFVGASLSGFGAKYLLGKVKDNYKNIAFGVVALVILVSPFFSYFKPHHLQLEDFNEQLYNDEIVGFLASQQKPFRMASFDVLGIDWNDIEVATVPLGVEETSHAFGGIWFTDYLQGFLSLAYRENLQDYAKVFGILNVKYVVSSRALNLSGLVFVNKFDEYKRSWPDFYDGPFLYLNERAVPRVFYPVSKILVVGEPERAKSVVRSIIVSAGFDPQKTAVVRAEKSSLTPELAVVFDGIIMLDGSAGSVLSGYNGVLFPKPGSSVIDERELAGFLSSFDKLAVPETALEYSQNSLLIKNPRKGLLVLSERYAMFSGWRAYVDGKAVEIYQADGIISAVIVPEGAKELLFVYAPEGFVFGAWLAVITLVVVLIYLVFFLQYCFSIRPF